jgi:hypothetical protein
MVREERRAGQDDHEPQADPGDDQDGEPAGDADEEALDGRGETEPVGAGEEEVERRREPQRAAD